MHVVIEPAQMTPAELYQGFKWAYRETFKAGSALRRVAGLGLRPNAIVNYFGNLCYRIFVKRLHHEARYAEPYSINDPKSLPEAGMWAETFLNGLPIADDRWPIPANRQSPLQTEGTLV